MGADFSGMQEYTKPDGTVVKMPPQLAAAFGASLKPAQPTPPLVPDPALEAGGRTPAIQLPEPTPQADAALMNPEQPGTRPSPPPKPQTAPSTASRAAAQPTDADLSRVGLTGVLGAQNAAVDTQAEATRRAAEAEAASIAQQGDALAARNEQIDKILQQRQAAAEERVRRVNEATIAADKAHQAYADHKIDRSIDHPRLALVGLLLGAVGSAMKGEGGNPAMDMLLKQQDRNVQAQMAEREKLRDVAAYKRGAIETVRQAGDDNISMYNLAMAGETEKTIRQIEQIKARSGSAQVKANADVAIAGLQEKKAGFLGEYVNRRMSIEEQQAARKQAAAEAAANRGIKYAEMAQAERFHNDAEARANRQLDVEVAKLMQKGKGDDAEKLAELGVGGVVNQKGDVFKAATKDEAKELREQKAAVDTINDFVGQITRGIKEYGGESEYFKSDDWMRQRSRIAFAKNAIRVGEKMGTLDSGSEKLMDEMAGAVDPTSFWRDASAGLTQMRDNLVTGFNYKLRAHPGFSGHEYKPPDTTKLAGPVITPEDKRAQSIMAWTPTPQAGGRQAGLIRQTGPTGADQLAGVRSNLDQWARAAREGKTPEDRTKAQAWLEKIRDSAQSPAVRAYAADLIDANVISSAPLPRERLPE